MSPDESSKPETKSRDIVKMKTSMFIKLKFKMPQSIARSSEPRQIVEDRKDRKRIQVFFRSRSYHRFFREIFFRFRIFSVQLLSQVFQSNWRSKKTSTHTFGRKTLPSNTKTTQIFFNNLSLLSSYLYIIFKYI